MSRSWLCSIVKEGGLNVIKLVLGVNGTKSELEVQGNGSKAEIYFMMGILEDLKYKLLSATQDDGTQLFFVKKEGESSKEGGK